MKPFNIQINEASTPITLTLLPTDEDYFKVIYYGGILGAISFNHKKKKWELVPPNNVEAGDLPPYTARSDDERVPLKLDFETIVKIGAEIEKSSVFYK